MIHQELWKTLKKLDPKEVERRSLASYDTKNKNFTLTICNCDYFISPEEQLIQATDSPTDPPVFYLHLAAVNYLIGAKDIPLDGRWVSEKEFPSGPLFFRGPHEMPAGKIVEMYGQNIEGFISVCQRLEGKKVEGGDAAFELLVFPRFPMRLILWLADEEFPARVSYLFDRTANVHLRLDGIWAAGNLVESLLTR
ncbi:DUF3786 domain-containing protein [Acidobacteriota bacterium]